MSPKPVESVPSDAGLPNEVRREQTERELARVERAVDTWFQYRASRDVDELGKYAGLHRTRLDSLQSVLQNGLSVLRQELAGVDVSRERDRGDVYAECRSFDLAIVWMQHIWEYYRDKFDQRDDRSGLGPLLQAADELVWSCYGQAFVLKQHLPPGARRGPAPLSYVAPDYSPATWEADKLSPSELRAGSDVQGLEGFLQTLPVPVLRLPPWCVEAPWWLVFVAHEVGHNVQHELDLVKSFESLTEKVCLEQGRPVKPDGDRWKRWSAEIFADLFSVAMLGRWAVRAMLEIELGSPSEMSRPLGSYPAPVVRLKLMARAGDRFGLNGSAALGDLRPEQIAQGNPIAEADLSLVEPFLDEALGPRAERPLSEQVGPLAKLCGVSEALPAFAQGGSVELWRKSLSGTPSNPTRSLQTPRFVVAGALAAWEAATWLAGPAERRDRLDVISRNTIGTLRKSGPEGTRAKTLTAAGAGDAGAALARGLLAAARRSPVDSEDA